MIDPSELKALVAEIFRPYVGSLGNPKPDKCVGFLVGVTIDGTRYYFWQGQLSLQQGGTLPAWRDIVFFIGSNTKVFTATLLPLASSAAANPVTPDTPVADLLPSNVSIDQSYGQILLWHLATHSAGFPDGVCGPLPHFGAYPFTSMKSFLNEFQPSYAPGEYWVYSNQGFALLGDVLSHAYATTDGSTDWDSTYKNWATLVMNEVVTPLGMASTQVDFSGVADAVVQTYNYTDKGGQPAYTAIDPPNWGMTSAGLAAGALSSTLDDMLTFLEAQITPPSGTLGDAIATTQQPWPSSDALSMGLGWQRSNDYLDKNGGLAGNETYMAFDPKQKIGVFVYGNTSGGSAGVGVNLGGRTLLGKIREETASPSKFPHPPTTPQCPT
jgi:beta-lactamase class C